MNKVKESVSLSDPPCKDGNARFTTVLLKALSIYFDFLLPQIQTGIHSSHQSIIVISQQM